jgi:hypothetical protein
VTNCGLNFEDSLTSRRTQVQNTKKNVIRNILSQFTDYPNECPNRP